MSSPRRKTSLDGFFRSDAAPVLKARFRDLDTNRDGMLDMHELTLLLRQGNPDLTDREVRGLFCSVDVDGSGKVNFDEFVDFVFELPTKESLPVDYTGVVLPDDCEAEAQLVRLAAAGEPTPKRHCLEICGAAFHPDVNGVYVKKAGMLNDHALYHRSFPPCVVFYGWTQGMHRVGWFIAKQPPSHGPVRRYKLFNPSPVAEAPEMCCATWETPGGNRDKRMFCLAIDSDDEDDDRQVQVDPSDGDRASPAELFKDRGSSIVSRSITWACQQPAADEDNDWEREWEEEIGEDIEDFEGEEGFEYEFDWADENADEFEVPTKVSQVLEEDDDGIFIDDEFPPNDETLGAALDPGLDADDPNCIAQGFMRLLNLHESPCLFRHIAPDDIVCGTSNKWFLSACAAVAEYPAWVQSMFGQITQLRPDGRYGVRIYHPGRKEFVRIVVDDYVPTKARSDRKTDRTSFPSYAGITLDGEVWAALVEKAFAKICGSYANTEWGTSTAYGLLYLCGGGGAETWAQAENGKWDRSYTEWRGSDDASKIDRKRGEGIVSDKVKIDADQLWKLMWDYTEHCYPVACTIKDDKSTTHGLLPDRAYSLVGTNEVPLKGLKLRMVFLRNPFGVSEWQGRWSDSSSAWKDCPSVAKLLRFKPRVDGTFWMSFRDFLQYFRKVDVVKKSMPVQGCHYVQLMCLKRRLGDAPAVIDVPSDEDDEDDFGY